MRGACSRRGNRQKMQFSGSLPSWIGALVPNKEATNPNRERCGRIYKVWKTGYPDTASCTSIAAAPNGRAPERNFIS